MKTMDRILKYIFIFLIIFTLVNMVIFCVKGAVPDTLIQYVFIACTGEFSAMGVIQTTKTWKKKYIGKEDKKESEE